MIVASVTSLFVLSVPFLAVALTYVGVNIAYSFWLKSVVLLDGMAIACGFVLRTYAGAIAIGAAMSDWLYLCALLIALFLAFCKRRHELALLREAAPDHRSILDEYPLEFLDQLISILTAATLVSYSLYTLDTKVISVLSRGEALKLTIPFVIYGIFRYHSLIFKHDAGEAPDEVLLKDKPLHTCILLWAAAVTVLLLLPG